MAEFLADKNSACASWNTAVLQGHCSVERGNMCTNLMDQQKDKINNSDVRMLANQKFKDIVAYIQDSNLNYSLKVSPFSAVISLKKSFIKDQSGELSLPTKNSMQKTQNVEDYITLKNKFDSLVKQYTTEEHWKVEHTREKIIT